MDLLLVHEWPKGLFRRTDSGGKKLRAYRFPWIGNPISRDVMDHLQPAWVFAGHSHVPFATSVTYGNGKVTRVACLDQAAKPARTSTSWKFSSRSSPAIIATPTARTAR